MAHYRAMPKSSSPKQQRGFLSRLGIGARKWEADHLPQSNEITPADTMLYGAGTTTVASLLASGTRQARTRQSIYDKWAQMEADPIVSAAVKLLVTSALGGHETSGDIVFIEKRPAAEQKEELGRIVDEIREDLSAILNRAAYPMAYLGSVFGDSYARIYTDKKDGVVDLYVDELVRPPLVQPFDRGSRTVGYAIYTGERNFQRLDTVQMARLKMPRSQWVPQHGVFEKSLRLALSTDDIDELPLMPAMAGGSLIYPAEEPYDKLTASLLGLVGQRWMDSIDEQMLTVNLNDMSQDMQKKFMGSIKDMLTRSKEIAEGAVKGGRPIMERVRHVIPVFGEKQLTRVEGGGQNGRSDRITIEDVMLHARLLSGAIGVDLSMIGFADQMGGGLGEGGFFRTSAQAAESARVIRVALAEAFNHIIDMHTLKRYGTVFPASERPWRINFYGSISALEAERQRTLNDGMSVGLGLTQAISAMRDMGASRKILEAFLTDTMQLDEEQAKVYAQLAEMGKDEDSHGGKGWP